MQADNRLIALDYLRGLAALSIMGYHYLGWAYGHFDAGAFMGRVGVYGVAIFYVLSGLTLYHVYYHRMSLGVAGLKDFFLKRLFRIFPLLWLVMGISLLITKEEYSAYEIFLNFTGLFGLLKWEAYIGTGVWSIGNELVFYLFFPVFMYLSRNSKALFGLFSLFLFGLYAYFAFYVLEPQQPMSSQWATFINPQNQVFLFLGGYLIGYVCERWKVPAPLSFSILIFACALFIFYPVGGDVIQLVTGSTRLLYTLLCFLLCFALYKVSFTLPAIADKPLRLLGEASYALYLLHPIVWYGIKGAFALLARQGIAVSLEVQLIIAALITLFLSHLVYVRYERYFIQLGKKLSGSNKPQPKLSL